MNAIDALREMRGKYDFVRSDPLAIRNPEVGSVDMSQGDCFKEYGATIKKRSCSIVVSCGLFCYDANDPASTDASGVVRVLVRAPNGRVWLDTFTPFKDAVS